MRHSWSSRVEKCLLQERTIRETTRHTHPLMDYIHFSDLCIIQIMWFLINRIVMEWRPYSFARETFIDILIKIIRLWNYRKSSFMKRDLDNYLFGFEANLNYRSRKNACNDVEARCGKVLIDKILSEENMNMIEWSIRDFV